MTESLNSIFDTFASRLKHDLPRLEAKVETYDRLAAPRLNPFLVLRAKENAVNRFIADLLDPHGAHGQGTLFLNAILDAIGLMGVDFPTHGRVTTEAPTATNRRIDIVVEGPDWVVGIENKFDAIQQSEQLDDYWIDLRGRGKVADKTCLIFLSDQTPKTKPDTLCRQITYARSDEHPCLPDILAATLPHVEAERTRSLVHDFLTYIALDRRSESMTDAHDRQYLQYLKEPWSKRAGSFDDRDGAMVKAVAMAMQLGEAEFQRMCVNRIGNAIIQSLSNHGVEVLPEQQSLYDMLYDGEDSWVLRHPSWPTACYVGLGSEKKGMLKIFYGVQALDGSDADEVLNAQEQSWGPPCDEREEVIAVLKADGHLSTAYAWWPYCKDYIDVPEGSRDWSVSDLSRMVLATDGGDIVHHRSVQSMINHLLKIAVTLNARWAPKS